MVAVIRRSLYPFILGMLVVAGIFFAAESAQAQCNSISITNNLNCDVVLCLYNASSAASICSPIIPAGGTGSITVPAGWTPTGGVSQSGVRYPFDNATGCTDCYRQITSSAVKCCGVVCYDRATCSIKIGPCPTTVCNP